ncbi:uncharacterized protein LOC118192307 [Stegodyphus dumicola]|uniref:uncharacterized protein LOC118192307 n=1 Tax=Stegodyphus dumicola TaxID=202533 RepID=UPI0015AE0D1A|nr:uncharacterized protein LOC118192307 [Stegodyphus dumicola]
MLQAIVIIIIFVLQLEKKIPFVNVSLVLLLNDCVVLIFYFITCTLAMLSIGRCQYRVAARIIAMLFSVALFLVIVGLNYTGYKWWKETSSKENSKDPGTTITESSPTVLA